MNEIKVSKKVKRIFIQKRDVEVFKLCLEMKFSDIESINEIVFRNRDLNMFVARKRVQKLEATGYLKSIILQPGSLKKYYVSTKLAYLEVIKIDQESNTPRAIKKLSQVTFEHDLCVLKSRIWLENQGRAFSWISERLLKTQLASQTGTITRYFLPDGLFTSKNGKICAFEYENKPKSEQQLREKIIQLNSIMSKNDPIFELCLFIASTESLKTKIQKITQMYPSKFLVQSVSEIQTQEPKNEHK